GNPDLLEQLLLRHRRNLGCALALHHLREHRGGGLRDRAPAAGEHDVVDRVAVLAEGDVDRDLVAAPRVLALGLGVGALHHPVTARVLVVVEDDLAVELVELAHPTRSGAGKAGTCALCERPSSLRLIAPRSGAGKAGTCALCEPPSSLRLIRGPPSPSRGPPTSRRSSRRPR